MLFSKNLFAALLAVAAVRVTGSPVELQKRDSIGSAQWCSGDNCELNGWIEPTTPTSLNCYQTGDICWLDSFVARPADGNAGGIFCTLYT